MPNGDKTDQYTATPTRSKSAREFITVIQSSPWLDRVACPPLLGGMSALKADMVAAAKERIRVSHPRYCEGGTEGSPVFIRNGEGGDHELWSEDGVPMQRSGLARERYSPKRKHRSPKRNGAFRRGKKPVRSSVRPEPSGMIPVFRFRSAR